MEEREKRGIQICRQPSLMRAYTRIFGALKRGYLTRWIFFLFLFIPICLLQISFVSFGKKKLCCFRTLSHPEGYSYVLKMEQQFDVLDKLDIQ